MKVKFTNNAVAKTISPMTAESTNIDLEPGKGELFPDITEGEFFHGVLTNRANKKIEHVRAILRAGDTIVVEREPGNANEFPVGSLFDLRLVAPTLNELKGSPSTGIVSMIQGGLGNADGKAVKVNKATKAKNVKVAKDISTVLPVLKGGTTSSTASAARVSLNLIDLDDVQVNAIPDSIVRRTATGGLSGGGTGDSDSSVLLPPTIVGPTTVPAGASNVYTFSSRSYLKDQHISHFVVRMEDGVVVQVTAANDLGSFILIVPNSTINGTVHTFSVRAVDTVGNQSTPSEWTYTVTSSTLDAVNRPYVVTPVNGATGVHILPTFNFSEFSTVSGTGVASGTEYQVARDEVFSNVTVNYSGAYITTVTLTEAQTLPISTKFFIRVRHKNEALGYSPWSPTNVFTITDAFIHTPSITSPANGATGVALKPTIGMSAFAVTGLPPAHAERILSVFNHTTSAKIADYSVPVGSATSYTIPAALPINTDIRISIKDKDTNLGWSPNSVNIVFHTVNATLNTPSITYPSNNATNVSPSPIFTFSPAVFTNQTVTQMRVRVYQGGSLAKDSGVISYSTSWSTSSLSQGTTYAVEVSYNGSITGWSNYSSRNTFTVTSTPLNTKWEITSSQTWTPPIPNAKYGVALWGRGGDGSVEPSGAIGVPGGGGGGAGGYLDAKIANISTPLQIVIARLKTDVGSTVSGGMSLSAPTGGNGYSGADHPDGVRGSGGNGGTGGGAGSGFVNTGTSPSLNRGGAGGAGGGNGAPCTTPGDSSNGKTGVAGRGQGGGISATSGGINAVGAMHGSAQWSNYKPYSNKPDFANIPGMKYGTSGGGFSGGVFAYGGGGSGYGNGAGVSVGSTSGVQFAGYGGGGSAITEALMVCYGEPGICVIVLMGY